LYRDSAQKGHEFFPIGQSIYSLESSVFAPHSDVLALDVR